MKDDASMKTHIAVALAVVVFTFFFFGGRIFPRLFVFDLFQSSVFGSRIAAEYTSAGIGADSQDAPSSLDEYDVSSLIALSGLSVSSDPVFILDLEEGSGTVAQDSNEVHVGYRGIFIDQDSGEEIVFDENTDRDRAFSFTLGSGQVISGFDAGVAGMREGGRRLVVIQPELGYGDQQVGVIPPNTVLHFLVELYEVRSLP